MELDQQWQVNFGARLRTERERKGLTRLALANLADTKQNYIAEIERGDRKPSLPTFVNILLALDISADSIIFGVPRENTVLSDFIGFLERRDIEEVKALFEIAKVASKYIGLNHKP